MRKIKNRTMCSILAVITSLLLLPYIASCSKVPSGDKIKVIGSVFPPFDFAREIGGENIECEMLLRPGADSHSYTGDDPSDIYRILNCDLFIYVGGETDEEWVGKVKAMCEDNGGDAPRFISLTETCGLLKEDRTGILEAEDETEDADAEYDEHVWTSPSHAASSCKAICDALCEIDPAHAEDYRTNLDNYQNKLSELDEKFIDLANSAKCKTVVFADRFPFRYLADEMNLETYAAFNGCASQSEPSPTTIASLCRIVEEKNIKYVFYIETSNSEVPDLISKSTGCGALLLHSCHTVTTRQLDDGVSYLSLMEINLENLKEALLND